MRSVLTAATAALLLALLSACVPQQGADGHPNPIIIREFEFSPGVVTLDPSFGFSLQRGEPGVPPRQRAAGLGRAVAFSVADAMAEHLTSLGYDVLRSDSATVEPDGRALVVRGTFRRINEGYRRRVGAENCSVAVDAVIEYHVGGAAPRQLAGFQLDSRQVTGGRTPDVKIAASRLGAAIGRYAGDTARLNSWPGAGR